MQFYIFYQCSARFHSRKDGISHTFETYSYISYNSLWKNV